MSDFKISDPTVARLTLENLQLRDAVVKYGEHQIGCAKIHHMGNNDCDCGWDAILAQFGIAGASN